MKQTNIFRTSFYLIQITKVLVIIPNIGPGLWVKNYSMNAIQWIVPIVPSGWHWRWIVSKKFLTRFPKLLFVDYNQHKQSLQIQIVCQDF